MVIDARIEAIDRRPLSTGPPVQIIRLSSPELSFHAGQYVEVIHPDGTRIPLSIASTPETLPALTLHFRAMPGLPEADRMDELLNNGPLLHIGQACGDVQLLPHDANPLFLISGGTGISQALCLATAQTLRHPRVDVCLLACSDHCDDFYFQDVLPVGDFFRSTFIADPARSETNQALGWLRDNARSIVVDNTVVDSTRIILSGSPGFVYAATDTLITAGLPAAALESDVYTYAPR